MTKELTEEQCRGGGGEVRALVEEVLSRAQLCRPSVWKVTSELSVHPPQSPALGSKSRTHCTHMEYSRKKERIWSGKDYGTETWICQAQKGMESVWSIWTTAMEQRWQLSGKKVNRGAKQRSLRLTLNSIAQEETKTYPNAKPHTKQQKHDKGCNMRAWAFPY